MKTKSKILIIAGSDSSGGAGIQADIKTVTALGGYAMTAVTAVTVQNTKGVNAVVPIKPKEIGKQILFTCKDIKPDGIKIGMLHSSQVIMSVVNVLKKIKTLEDMIRAANILLKFGVKNVLLKGGHRKSKYIEDILLNRKEIKIFKNKKIKTKNTHGTGCTLSSAIATFLSCGKPLKKSCELGIKYVNQAIRSNPNYGKGHGPVNHLNSILIDKKFR